MIRYTIVVLLLLFTTMARGANVDRPETPDDNRDPSNGNNNGQGNAPGGYNGHGNGYGNGHNNGNGNGNNNGGSGYNDDDGDRPWTRWSPGGYYTMPAWGDIPDDFQPESSQPSRANIPIAPFVPIETGEVETGDMEAGTSVPVAPKPLPSAPRTPLVKTTQTGAAVAMAPSSTPPQANTAVAVRMSLLKLSLIAAFVLLFI